MPQLLDELYALSDNSALFGHLRTGGDPAMFAGSVPSGSRQSTLLRAFRAAIMPALQSADCSALQTLIKESDTPARVTILGELILTLHALAEGKRQGQNVEAIHETAFHLARDLAGAMEAKAPQDSGDANLLEHGVALREWAHLFAGYYQAAGRPEHGAELLMIRARVTNCTLSSWPHLVGPAMLAWIPIGPHRPNKIRA